VKFIRPVLIVFLLACCACSDALADTVEFRGVRFAIDSMVSVPGLQVKVLIGHRSLLVSSNELPRKIAMLYLTTPELMAGLSVSQLTQILVESVKQKDEELAAAGLRTLLVDQQRSVDDVRSILAKCTGDDALIRALERALISLELSSTPTNTVCVAMSILPEASRRLVKEKASQVLVRLQFKCSEYLQRLARTSLEQVNLDESVRYLDALTQSFADGSETFKPIIAARNKLARLRDSLKGGEYFVLGRAIRSIADDEWFKPNAAKTARDLVETAIEQALADNKTASALHLLAVLDFNNRTPKDHELTLKILKVIGPQDGDTLVLPEVVSILRSFAIKDEGIRNEYVRTLDRVLTGLLGQGTLPLVNTLFDQLVTVRPDPSAANDALRQQYIIQLLRAGAVAEARDKLAEIRTDISYGTYIRIFLGGGFAPRELVIALIIGIVVAAIVFFLDGRRIIGFFVSLVKPADQEHFAEPLTEEIEEEDDEPAPRRFVVYSQGVKVAHAIDEYAECLGVFALQPGATLQQIKFAYRNAVKTCHPDLNPHAGPAEAAKFIQLTKTYERLLRLHTEQTGEES